MKALEAQALLREVGLEKTFFFKKKKLGRSFRNARRVRRKVRRDLRRTKTRFESLV